MSTDKTNQRSNPIVKKVVKNTAKLGEGLPVVLPKGSGLGDYLRLFLGSPDGVNREMILHRPIGMTDLDGDDWVASDPGDVPLLLSRKEDPFKQSIAAQRSKWFADEAVKAGFLKLEENGDVVYTGSNNTTRKDFFKELKEEFEKKNPKSKVKFELKDALSRSVDPRAGLEAKIRSLNEELAPEADLKFKSTFRTKGGPRGDRPQVAVKWANKRSLTELADMLLKHGIDGPFISPSGEDDGDTMSIQMPESMIVAPAGPNKGQWCFFPPGLKKTTRAKAKDALKAIKDSLETESGKKIICTIQFAKEQD